jgi:alpha-glucosidase
MDATYIKKEKKMTPLVLTDSTFAGLGKTGAAHLFPGQNPRYVELQRQLNSMINFGMFGMPNVGASLCNYESIAAKKDEDLCARYFQLSIVSPLAVFADR